MEIVTTAQATTALASFTGVITDNIPGILVIAGSLGAFALVRRAISKNLNGKASV